MWTPAFPWMHTHPCMHKHVDIHTTDMHHTRTKRTKMVVRVCTPCLSGRFPRRLEEDRWCVYSVRQLTRRKAFNLGWDLAVRHLVFGLISQLRTWNSTELCYSRSHSHYVTRALALYLQSLSWLARHCILDYSKKWSIATWQWQIHFLPRPREPWPYRGTERQVWNCKSVNTLLKVKAILSCIHSGCLSEDLELLSNTKIT